LRGAAIVALGAALVACGGEEETAGSTNHAPTIAGLPPTTIGENVQYSFTPTATDPDGDALIFGIDAKPSWATFDTSTGQLSGKPSRSNVGRHRGVVVWVSDGNAQTLLPPFDVTVTESTPTNRPPTITGTPPTTVMVGTAYSFTPTASDPDGNPLTFAVTNRPAWATFDAQTGQLSGTPTATGTFNNIAIAVSDGQATTSLPAFTLTVTTPPAPANRPPTITGTPPTAVTQGTTYGFQPAATDPDGNALTFVIANRPSWASFNSSTGALVGTPGPANVGTYNNIVIGVSDGTLTASLSAFAITVAAANVPPTISGVAPTSATVGTQYTFTPTAVDANGGTLTFSITNRPAWATFSALTGRLQGTPTSANVGTFANIVIAVSDGQATAQLPAFAITVAAGNAPPTISGTPGTAVMQGTSYTFAPSASDPDGNALSFSIANPPAWATFNTTTGRLQGTPGPGDVGTTTGIVITVSDGTLSASLPAFALTVQAVATGSAMLSWTPPTSNTDGSPLTNLAGYKIYWGTVQGTYPNSVTLNNPGLTSHVVDSLVPGTYFFVATALNAVGAESTFSTVASKTIQ
jgi:hypothetical protein